MDEHIKTAEEFNREVRGWGNRVRKQAAANAAAFPHGKRAPHSYSKGRWAGITEGRLKNSIKTTSHKVYGEMDGVGFKFPVHGIFRAYGVGNGQPRHGRATKSGRAASTRIYRKRTPADWINPPIESNMPELADIVADYYGDKVLVEFRKMDVNRVAHEGVL